MKLQLRFCALFLALIIGLSGGFSGVKSIAYAEETAKAVENVKITFKDGEKIIGSAEIEKDTKISDIPLADAKGNEIIAWVYGGKRITDLTAITANADMEFFVWKAPELIENKHIPYMSGTEKGGFAPNNYLTRAEFCVIYNSLFKIHDNGIKVDMKDVTKDQWHYKYVSNVIKAGILDSRSENKFYPDHAISRAEFVDALCRSCKTEMMPNPFYDVKGHWAAEAITFARSKGWVTGDDNGLFKPNSTISRAEATVILNIFLDRSGKKAAKSLLSSTKSPFYDVESSDWYFADVMEATLPHTSSGKGKDEKWVYYEYPDSVYKPGLVTIHKNVYYVGKDGAFTFFKPHTFATLHDGKTYLTTSGGLINTGARGLYEHNGDLYCFGNDGSVMKNGWYGNLYFGSDGKYTTGDSALDSYVDSALASCTTQYMTKEAKLRAAYLFVRDSYTYLSRDHHPRGSTGFVHESASFMFKNKKGNCYCFASCFLLMARRLGYHDAYVVSGGVGKGNDNHAWVMINSKIYDPELEYAYRYRYEKKKNYDLYAMSVGATPFNYYFP